MSAKRKPLSLSPEKFTTQTISDPVTQAVAPSYPETRFPHAKSELSQLQRSRAGRVQVVAWVTPEQRTELKVIAARSQRTIDEMIVSMIANIIASQGE